MSTQPLNSITYFLGQLTEVGLAPSLYSLHDVRDGAVTVIVRTEGTFWEVDFCADGTVDVERFDSSGPISDASALPDLLAAAAAAGAMGDDVIDDEEEDVPENEEIGG